MVISALFALLAPRFRPYKHTVITWVPFYAVAASRKQLEADFGGGVGMKDGLTHLALQYWVPTADGRVAYAGSVADADVIQMRDWAHGHGIRALLCVFNGEVKWDWPLARAAFVRPEFVNNLVAEVDRLGLDGIDVDLEGPGEFEADKPAHLDFMTNLSKELRRRKKHLMVDTFAASKWNTPNQSWWPQLFPLVDAITTMGYEEIGAGAPEWHGYEDQKRMAGKFAAKLQLGLPGTKGAWLGRSVTDQLDWIRTDGTVGMAFWDAQLQAAEWRTSDVWRLIQKIHA